MTLEQCLEVGVKNNPSLNAARIMLDGADYDIKTARADFLPSVSSGYSATVLTSQSSKGLEEEDYLDQTIRSFNIKLTQILYAGARIVNTYKKAKITKQVQQAEMALQKLELVYNIETTFYRLMKARQDVIMLTESLNRLAESTRAAQAFFDKELVPYVDVLQARVDLAEAKEQMGIAKNNVNREKANLFSLMNIPFDPDVLFAEDHYQIEEESYSFDNSLQQAKLNRPDIKSFMFQRDIAQKEARISLGKYLPVVTLEAGYFDQDRDYEEMTSNFLGPVDRDQRNRYWSTGVSVTWNMFDGGRSWFEREKYKTEIKRLNALINEAENMIATGIRKALFSLSEAEERIQGSTKNLTAAKEFYAREEKRLKAGISTIPALLDAQERLIRAQANKTQAILDYQLAKSELELMRGENNPELKNLP
ncbi:MAG: TolC family protein [Desulfobacterales bacterium]|nr:TolC family protein [Desulfobacterales bacterium]